MVGAFGGGNFCIDCNSASLVFLRASQMEISLVRSAINSPPGRSEVDAFSSCLLVLIFRLWLLFLHLGLYSPFAGSHKVLSSHGKSYESACGEERLVERRTFVESFLICLFYHSDL